MQVRATLSVQMRGLARRPAQVFVLLVICYCVVVHVARLEVIGSLFVLESVPLAALVLIPPNTKHLNNPNNMLQVFRALVRLG